MEWVISRMKTDGGGLTLKRLYCEAVTADSSTPLRLSPASFHPTTLSRTAIPARGRGSCQSQQRDKRVAVTLERCLLAPQPTHTPKITPTSSAFPGAGFPVATKQEAAAPGTAEQRQLAGRAPRWSRPRASPAQAAVLPCSWERQHHHLTQTPSTRARAAWCRYEERIWVN